VARTRFSWTKSSASGPNGNCVEVALVDDDVWVRHSKAPGEGALCFTRAEWEAFVVGVKAGEFDL
jgi:hypothetical protein